MKPRITCGLSIPCQAYRESEQSAATEGVFCFLGPLLVWSQVYDLTAVQIAGGLVGMTAAGSVEDAWKQQERCHENLKKVMLKLNWNKH